MPRAPEKIKSPSKGKHHTKAKSPAKPKTPRKRVTTPTCEIARKTCQGKRKDGKPCTRKPSCKLGCVRYCFQHAPSWVKASKCADYVSKRDPTKFAEKLLATKIKDFKSKKQALHDAKKVVDPKLKKVLLSAILRRSAVKEKNELRNSRKQSYSNIKAPLSLLWLYQFSKVNFLTNNSYKIDFVTYDGEARIKQHLEYIGNRNYRTKISWEDVTDFIATEGKGEHNNIWAVLDEFIEQNKEQREFKALPKMKPLLKKALKSEVKMFNKGYLTLYHGKNSRIHLTERIFKAASAKRMAELNAEKEEIMRNKHTAHDLDEFNKKLKSLKDQIRGFQMKLLTGFYPECVRKSDETLTARERAIKLGVKKSTDNIINQTNRRLISCNYSLFGNFPDMGESTLYYVMANKSVESTTYFYETIPFLNNKEKFMLKYDMKTLNYLPSFGSFGTGVLNQICIPFNMVDDLVYDSEGYGYPTKCKTIYEFLEPVSKKGSWDANQWSKVQGSQARITDLCYEQTTSKGVHIRSFNMIAPDDSAKVTEILTELFEAK